MNVLGRLIAHLNTSADVFVCGKDRPCIFRLW